MVILTLISTYICFCEIFIYFKCTCKFFVKLEIQYKCIHSTHMTTKVKCIKQQEAANEQSNNFTTLRENKKCKGFTSIINSVEDAKTRR